LGFVAEEIEDFSAVAVLHTTNPAAAEISLCFSAAVEVSVNYLAATKAHMFYNRPRRQVIAS
jgi:hypothetical protein